MHGLQTREKLVVGSNCKVALVDRTPVKIDGTIVSSAIFSRPARVEISPDCGQSRLSNVATGLELEVQPVCIVFRVTFRDAAHGVAT